MAYVNWRIGVNQVWLDIMMMMGPRYDPITQKTEAVESEISDHIEFHSKTLQGG